MYIYLETPGWPLEAPSGIRMRSWSPASACWLQTQPPPGSGEQKHKVNNSRLMLVVCNYPHYLLVGSVIIAGMSSSFPSIQCGNPVWSLRQNDKQTKNQKPQPCRSIACSPTLTWVLSSQREDASFFCSAPMINQLSSQHQPRRHTLQEVCHEDDCPA